MSTDLHLAAAIANLVGLQSYFGNITGNIGGSQGAQCHIMIDFDYGPRCLGDGPCNLAGRGRPFLNRCRDPTYNLISIMAIAV